MIAVENLLIARLLSFVGLCVPVALVSLFCACALKKKNSLPGDFLLASTVALRLVVTRLVDVLLAEPAEPPPTGREKA